MIEVLYIGQTSTTDQHWRVLKLYTTIIYFTPYKLHLATANKLLNEFHGLESHSGLNFFQALISQLLISCAYNCDDQLCLHIFLCSSKIWYFIYSFAFFNIYWYIELTMWPSLRWLHNSVGRIYCISIAADMGSNPIQDWIFLRLQFKVPMKNNCFLFESLLKNENGIFLLGISYFSF